MVAVKLFRKVGVFEEEYGRVLFDGKELSYDGLSSFFVKQLQKGVIGPDRKCYRPEDGLEFLKNLKYRFSNNPLYASDVFQCPNQVQSISSPRHYFM